MRRAAALLLCGHAAALFRVEVISTAPASLISATSPGITRNISGGFETGLVVKTDDGAYHMFASAFPPGPDCAFNATTLRPHAAPATLNPQPNRAPHDPQKRGL
jgi:hypothetical protein